MQPGECVQSLWPENKCAPHSAGLFQLKSSRGVQLTEHTDYEAVLPSLISLRPWQEPMDVTIFLNAMRAGYNQVMHRRGAELMRPDKGKYAQRGWKPANGDMEYDASIYGPGRLDQQHKQDGEAVLAAMKHLAVAPTQPELGQPYARRLVLHILRQSSELVQQTNGVLADMDVFARRQRHLPDPESAEDASRRWQEPRGPLVYAFAWKKKASKWLVLLRAALRDLKEAGPTFKSWATRLVERLEVLEHDFTDPGKDPDISIPYCGETIKKRAIDRERTHWNGDDGWTGLASKLYKLLEEEEANHKAVLLDQKAIRAIHDAARQEAENARATTGYNDDGYLKAITTDYVRLVAEAAYMELIGSSAKLGGLNVCTSGRFGANHLIRLRRVMAEALFMIINGQLSSDQPRWETSDDSTPRYPEREAGMNGHVVLTQDQITEIASKYGQDVRPFVHVVRFALFTIRGVFLQPFLEMDPHLKSFVEATYGSGNDSLKVLTFGKVESDMCSYAGE